ncbi:MAG: succinate dehydrogenase [Parachlamydiaceae bacterium]
MSESLVPKAFLARRLHSFFGLFLSGFLFFHLYTNSQAGVFGGKDYIKSVNGIHDIPYLLVIESLFLALPIVVHGLWGLKYLRSAEYNSFGGGGNAPYLPDYGRNRAYTWQRITSWILLFAVVLHVVHMRFYDAPFEISNEGSPKYFVKLVQDDGLPSVAQRLHVELLDNSGVPDLKGENAGVSYAAWKGDLYSGHVVAMAKDFGTAELLMVRDTFKDPLMMFLYTIFVFAACFHAFNGLWSFCIRWGVTLTQRSQELMLKFATLIMGVTMIFGLIAIYSTYWINLRH